MTRYENGNYVRVEETYPSEKEKQEYEKIEKHIFDNITYEELVIMFIREKYTLDNELAIQRQKETKPDEWEAYFAYCEECKKKAKKVLEVENE